jgi:hypothetical protein
MLYRTYCERVSTLVCIKVVLTFFVMYTVALPVVADGVVTVK